jgi:hypothetical protein
MRKAVTAVRARTVAERGKRAIAPVSPTRQGACILETGMIPWVLSLVTTTSPVRISTTLSLGSPWTIRIAAGSNACSSPASIRNETLASERSRNALVARMAARSSDGSIMLLAASRDLRWR